MPVAERVAEIRAQQEEAEKRASKKDPGVREAMSIAQEHIRVENLEAFDKFERQMHLREGLEALVKAEFLELKGAEIRTLVTEPVAVKVELILKWYGEPKYYYQEGVISTQSYGSSSLSITRFADGNIIVEGEKKVASFHESNFVEESVKGEFEKAVAQAYLKPRWNKDHDLIVPPSTKPPHDLKAWPPEERD